MDAVDVPGCIPPSLYPFGMDPAAHDPGLRHPACPGQPAWFKGEQGPGDWGQPCQKTPAGCPENTGVEILPLPCWAGIWAEEAVGAAGCQERPEHGSRTEARTTGRGEPTGLMWFQQQSGV